MPSRASAFAALGLAPGADAAAIEGAYKRLIKQYHPDREGGDSVRAAEINRAYRELRTPVPKETLELENHEFGAKRSIWTLVAILAAVASLALVAATAWMTPQVAATMRSESTPAPARPADVMDEPLQTAAVDQAIQRAATMARTGDELALTETSRDCHQQLRRDPSLAQLDRCAAFDSAVALLQDRDPLRDRGPFSELAVTSRLMRGGSLLSNDYLAIDGRLDQIRLRTELALVPRVEPPPLVNENPANETAVNESAVED